jgi:hypothetical protein
MTTIDTTTTSQSAELLLKEILPANFLFFRKVLTLNEIPEMVPVAKLLFNEAVRLNLHVTGPVHWHYHGFNGDPANPFTLEVALPVAEIPRDYDGGFNFKRTETYKAVSTIHEGDWIEMRTSYDRIFRFLEEHHLSPDGTSRELYINADFGNPKANLTLIQAGVF